MRKSSGLIHVSEYLADALRQMGADDPGPEPDQGPDREPPPDDDSASEWAMLHGDSQS